MEEITMLAVTIARQQKAILQLEAAILERDQHIAELEKVKDVSDDSRIDFASGGV